MNELTVEQKIRRKAREINDHVSAGKPCYWDVGQKRYRVFCARVSKGRLQVMPLASRKWLNASLADNFEFYR